MARSQLAGTVADRTDTAVDELQRRSLSVWSDPDLSALRRSGEDVEHVISRDGRRTTVMSVPAVTEDEARTWFG